MTDFLTLPEVAATLRVSPRTVRRALHDRRHPLPSICIGRRRVVAEDALQRWVSEQAAPVVPPKVADKLSPAARELIADLLGTPAAPRRAHV